MEGASGGSSFIIPMEIRSIYKVDVVPLLKTKAVHCLPDPIDLKVHVESAPTAP